MDTDEAVCFTALVCFSNLCKASNEADENQFRRVRRWKVRPRNMDWLTGGYHRKVFMQIKTLDDKQFFLYTRMSKNLFHLILNKIAVILRRPKQRIGTEERLSMTIKFLAHGVALTELSQKYKLGKTTVRSIVLETCSVIWNVLARDYVREPTQTQFESIADDFVTLCDMPHCLGVLGGKYIAVKCPPNTINKKFRSITLCAACDAKYSFTAVVIDKENDEEFFSNSSFGDAILNYTLHVPTPRPLPNTDSNFNYYFVSDTAFLLRPNLMRPFPGKPSDLLKQTFNYRLSRAHGVLENSFGILAARWRVLGTTVECWPENCATIVRACIALHNFLMASDHDRLYCPQSFVDSARPTGGEIRQGDWRGELAEVGGPLQSLLPQKKRSTIYAMQLRDTLAHYFLNEGAIPLQKSLLADQLETDLDLSI